MTQIQRRYVLLMVDFSYEVKANVYNNQYACSHLKTYLRANNLINVHYITS